MNANEHLSPFSMRPTVEADIPTVLEMFDHSRSLMRADGNLEQWGGYPTRDDLLDDIRRGVSYIILGQSSNQAITQPVGTVAMVPGLEPTYAYIDHGRWIDTVTPYTTLHRMAKAPGDRSSRGGIHGIADFCFAAAKERFSHLRVDTHASNRPMRHLLEKEGFVYCGIIYMPDGSPRVAYEWWRYDEVPESLKTFVEQEVLPQYDRFDAAHRRDHARRVIARAMMQQPTPMAYAAAAMHDLGLAEGREVHHLASGRLIRACRRLRDWFSEEEVELIAQAAEDHRASATTPPRSLLGCIIAEADRDIEPETIVRRTVEYGLSHYPELDREGHWQRTLEHLHEKYAEGGYIKLWLPDSPNAAPLADLRALIKDEKRLRTLFLEILEEKNKKP